MATTPRYVEQRLVDRVTYAANPAIATIDNGDYLKWDSVNGIARPMLVAADGPESIGIAEGNTPINSNVDNGSVTVMEVTVVRKTVALLKGTNAESYVNGDAVKLGADAQTVALAPGAGETIGYVNLPRGGTIVGATGVFNVPVEVTPRFPFVMSGV